MSKADEARQLRAQGVPITTLDGRQLTLIFDMEAIAEIEDHFGSLGGMQDALENIAAERQKAKFFQPILAMMRAGLSHDPNARDAIFDTALIGDYYIAVMKATDLAFPKDETSTVPTVGTQADTQTTNIKVSPGPTSIISERSDSDAVTARSGV